MWRTVVPSEYEDDYTIKPAYYRHNISLLEEKYMEKEEKSKKSQLTRQEPGAVSSPIIRLAGGVPARYAQIRARVPCVSVNLLCATVAHDSIFDGNSRVCVQGTRVNGWSEESVWPERFATNCSQLPAF
jgi:hypothetical protein